VPIRSDPGALAAGAGWDRAVRGTRGRLTDRARVDPL